MFNLGGTYPLVRLPISAVEGLTVAAAVAGTQIGMTFRNRVAGPVPLFKATKIVLYTCVNL